MTTPPADADKTGEATVCAKCETTDVFYIQSIADLTARLVKEEARAERMEDALKKRAKKLNPSGVPGGYAVSDSEEYHEILEIISHKDGR